MDENLLPVDWQQGGAVAPYEPSAPLSPSPEPSWLVPDVDHLTPAQHSPQQAIFGQPIPGVTAQQAQQAVSAILDAFKTDMQALGVAQHFANAAADWYSRMAMAPVPNEPGLHGYSLRGFKFEPADRPHINAFCNHMDQIGAPQQVVRLMLSWYQELGRRAQQAQKAQAQQPQTGGVSDAEWAQIERRCESDKEATKDTLRTHWGQQWQTKLQIVLDYFHGLPAHEQDHFEYALLPGGQLGGNNPEVILRLYDQATGGALPTGGNLQAEINMLESRMVNDRRAWFRDDAAQGRLRRLYQLRDGG